MLRAAPALRPLAALLVLALAACSNPAVELCTKKTTDLLFSQCKQSSAYDVSGDCMALDGAHEAYEAGGYAVKACEAGEEGVYDDCAVKHPTECASADETVQKNLRATCSMLDGNPHGRTPECTQTCADARKTCDAACPKDTAKACLDCSAACGIQQAKCALACPERTG